MRLLTTAASFPPTKISVSQQEHYYKLHLPVERKIFLRPTTSLPLEPLRSQPRAFCKKIAHDFVSYQASVHCIFDEAHIIVMSVVLLLITVAIQIAHGLPLNSPLLPSYDYIGKPSIQPKDVTAQHRQSSVADRPVSQSPTVSPKIQASMYSSSKPALQTTAGLS